jgi:hypothetical protein
VDAQDSGLHLLIGRQTLGDYTGFIAVIEAKIIWADGIEGE